MSNKQTRVRFAPSPTGFLHVGGLRTALFNFLWAKKNKGDFILRIEDTDRAREIAGATENIVATLKHFKLDFDEGPNLGDRNQESGVGKDKYGPFVQSQRLDIYNKHIQILLDKGAAYKCYCTAERIDELKKQADASKVPFKYDKFCLKNPDPSAGSGSHNFVIRQNIPEQGTVEFEDEVYGRIRVENRTLDDGVLIKSDGWPVYNFANVVDDHHMAITHVIRGEEFIASTPKHIHLYEAFGWPVPKFVHLPLLLSRERKKLSKRDGDVAVKEYLDKGYLPEALLNFVAFLGWNPKTEKEIFSLDELIAEFDLKKINRAGAVFDPDKLDWFNAQYLRNKTTAELVELVRPYLPVAAGEYPQEFLAKIVEIERERLKKLSEIGERTSYFFIEPQYDGELLKWKNASADELKSSLTAAKTMISNFKSLISETEIEDNFLKRIGDADKGTMLWPLRVALSGLKASPGPFEIIEAFMSLPKGKEIMAKRIDLALEKLAKL